MRAVLIVTVAAAFAAAPTSAAPPFSLKSPAFKNGARIPERYTCVDHSRVSPPLAWMRVPKRAVELALVMDDPDAPGGTFTHWLTWGISPKGKGLAQGRSGPRVGTNDGGRRGYLGPCPPPGAPHRYVFTLFALKGKLKLAPGANRKAFNRAIRGRVLKKAVLRGRFGRAAPPFTLTSSAFADGGPIPAKHTCDGADTSPPLRWSGTPAGTKSLAIVVEDPDAGGFLHWLTWNIAPNVVSLENRGGALSGRNDFGASRYDGPCPPPAHGAHRYVFTLYALSAELTLPAGATKPAFDAAIKGLVLGRATLAGTYDR